MSDPLVILCSMDWDNRWCRLIDEHLTALGLGGQRLAHVTPDAAGHITHRGARGLETARLAVLVVSPEFLGSHHMRKAVLPKLVLRASVVVRHGQKVDAEFLPVIVKDCQWGQLPESATLQVPPDMQTPLDKREPRDVHKALAATARRAWMHLQMIQALPDELQWQLPPEAALHLGPLAGESLTAEHQDRDELIHRLSLAWMDSHTRIACLVGEAGVGKTTMLAQWLRVLARDKYRGAQQVFVWSFRDSGSPGTDTPAGEFVQRAGECFGLLDDPSLAWWEVGARLARRVEQLRALVILDGLDELLRPNERGAATLRDEAVLMFLRKLAQGSGAGLCVIASRQPLADLALWDGKSLVTLPVESFSMEEGVELLQRLRVPGEPSTLRDAAECAQGDPLALRALGTWLASSYRKETGRAGDFTPLFAFPARQRRAAMIDHVLAALDPWPAGDLLAVLSLFDRPALPNELELLLSGPPLLGLTDRLVTLPDADRQKLVANLRLAGLVQLPAGGGIDLHPLIRAAVLARLPPHQAAARRTAQEWLAEHFRPPGEGAADGSVELARLLRTMHHGSQSSLPVDKLVALFEQRIWGADDPLRMNSVRQVAARTGVLANLLSPPTMLPRDELSATDCLLVCRRWRRGLRAVGRLAEASFACERQLQLAAKAQHHGFQVESLLELCELLLLQGRIKDATRRVNELFTIPDLDKNQPLFRDAVNLSARVLHVKGRLADALHRYRLVESLPLGESLLCGAQWWHCEAILDSGNFPLTERLAWKEWERLADQNGLAAAGHLLVLTRLYLALWKHSGDVRYRQEAQKHLQRSLQLARRTGMIEMILAAQLAEAGHHRSEGKLPEAAELLTDVAALVTRCGLRLLAIDCQLEWARLRLDQGRPRDVQNRLEAIKQQLQESLYGRVAPELAQIEQRFLPAKPDPKLAGVAGGERTRAPADRT
jgi:hypothetical protein